ncbi:hypothetical protein BGAL_0070g00130 [Botrytis galanthina]|uniref:Uncharacterized protein n=1 Tax=Botrytis galanthina TaxID=278940 RepID=A0A4S8R740_9HELO|nr:hypothetical protein BGAL_0070g00130 [Botrytis galanthina]
MIPLDTENPWFDREDDEPKRSARFTDFIENLESVAPQRYVQLISRGESGGYPKEPLIVNELENYFDTDVLMTQRVRRDSRITENKWRGIIAAKMKIMIDEYKKGNNSSYHQANGDPWGSSSSGDEKFEANGSNQGRSSSVNDNFAAEVGQCYQKINQHPQPSLFASQTGTKHGRHTMTSGSTTYDTETTSKNIIAKKRKQSTLISETSDASTEPKPKHRSGKNIPTSTVDDPMTSLNARSMSMDKTQKRMPFDEKMK